MFRGALSMTISMLCVMCVSACCIGVAVTPIAYPIHEAFPHADYTIILMIVGAFEFFILGLVGALAFAGLNFLFFKYKRKFDDRPVEW